MRILISNACIYTGNEVKEGYIYIDKDRIADIGYSKEFPIEYEFSELHYTFKNNAVIFRGFSIAITPSLYPCRGSIKCMDYSIFSKDEIKAFIASSFYNLLMTGVTLPIIFNEPYIDLLYDIIRSYKLKSIIIIDEEDPIDKFLYVKGVTVGTTSKGLSDKYSIPYIDRSTICTLEEVGNENCKIVYVKDLYSPQYILIYRHIYGKDIRSLLFSGYLLVSGTYNIEVGTPADLIIYKLDKIIHTPLLKIDPLSIIARGFSPDLVIQKGEIVVEENMNYVFNERDLLKNLKLII